MSDGKDMSDLGEKVDAAPDTEKDLRSVPTQEDASHVGLWRVREGMRRSKKKDGVGGGRMRTVKSPQAWRPTRAILSGQRDPGKLESTGCRKFVSPVASVICCERLPDLRRCNSSTKKEMSAGENKIV